MTISDSFEQWLNGVMPHDGETTRKEFALRRGSDLIDLEWAFYAGMRAGFAVYFHEGFDDVPAG